MKRTYLHSFPLRLWHWVNALFVVLLLVTGVLLRISGVPGLSPGSGVLLLHRYAGWAMAVSFVLWLIAVLATRYLGRYYRVSKRDIRGIFGQAKFYLWSIFRHEENPFRPSANEKFNPLQKVAYGAIMCIFTPLLALTGMLLDAPLTRKYILLWDAARLLDLIHVVAAYVFALYFIVHVYMATLGHTPLSHIKAMVVGYEEETEP